MNKLSLELGNRSAEISECGTYRYSLRRQWAEGYQVLFVMLNPSTADALAGDPTIRRCVGFAKSWGFSQLAVANLFALRSTDPHVLMRCGDIDPVGPRNDEAIIGLAEESTMIVAAWGNHGIFLGRSKEVRRILGATSCLYHLGLTKSGQPRHPLYLPGDTQPGWWPQP